MAALLRIDIPLMFVIDHQVVKADQFDGGNALVRAIIQMLDGSGNLVRKTLLDPGALDRGVRAERC